MSENWKSVIKDLVKDINKQEGANKPIIFNGTDLKNIECVSTGLESLDAITNGGIPKRRISIIWGGPGAGKSTQVARIIGNFQKEDERPVLYIDSEINADPVWLQTQGVDMGEDRLLTVQGGTFEANMNIVLKMLRAKATSLVVVDTVHALARLADLGKAGQAGKGERSTKKIRDIDLEEEARMGGHGAILSRFFRTVAGEVARAGAAMVLVGQTRENLSPYTAGFDVLPGGRALKHYSSLTLHFARMQGKDYQIFKKNALGEDEKIGFTTKITVGKTRLSGDENAEVKVQFLNGIGPDDFRSVIEQGMRLGLIERAGAYYTAFKGTDDEVRVQGRDATFDYFKDNEDKLTILKQKISDMSSYEETEEVEEEVVNE